MGILSSQPNDVKLEVADLFISEISSLRLSNLEKLDLIKILDSNLESDCNLVKFLLNVDNPNEIFQDFIQESKDFLEEEAMENDI